MTYNLKNRPKPIILKGSPKILHDVTIPISWKEYEKWFEGFEKKFRKLNTWNWLKENYPNYNEDNLMDFNVMLRSFIKKEILGEK